MHPYICIKMHVTWLPDWRTLKRRVDQGSDRLIRTHTMVSFIVVTTCKQCHRDPTDRASPQQCSKQHCFQLFGFSSLKLPLPFTSYMLFRPASAGLHNCPLHMYFTSIILIIRKTIYCGPVG